MYNMLIQILAAFIPNKAKRRAFRSKYKTVLKKSLTKMELAISSVEQRQFSNNSILFNFYQQVILNERIKKPFKIKEILSNPKFVPITKLI